LNAIPFLGAAKNTVELVRGRDFIPDRAIAVRPMPLAGPSARPLR
jgi:hypothetical protein